jgi:hypothetical protein
MENLIRLLHFVFYFITQQVMVLFVLQFHQEQESLKLNPQTREIILLPLSLIFLSQISFFFFQKFSLILILKLFI